MKVDKRTGRRVDTITQQRRNISEERFLRMDREEEEKKRALNPRPVEKGYRAIIIDTYKKNRNIEEVFDILDEINKKISAKTGRKVFTKDIVKGWLTEEFGTSILNKGEKGIDSDDAR